MVELVWEELHSLKRRTGERRMLIRTVVDQLPVRIRWELDVFQKLALPSEWLQAGHIQNYGESFPA